MCALDRDLIEQFPDTPGHLTFGGVRIALLDVEEGFWSLRRQLEALVGRRLADNLLQQAGANGGASFARSLVGEGPVVDGPQALRDCIAAYQAAGFGHFVVDEIRWPIGQAVVRGWDTFESWAELRHRKPGHEPACAYTAGVLVGFLNVIAGRRDVVCVKRTCQAQGDESCVFELLPAGDAGEFPLVAHSPHPALGRQLNLLEVLFERMPMGIAVFDRDYRLSRCNPTWVELLTRYTPTLATSVVPGVSYFELEPGVESAVMPVFDRVLAGETVHLEAFPITSGVVTSYWDVALRPLIEDEEVVGFLDVTTDATERVLARRDLELRVAERTRELTTLLEVSRQVASTNELEPLLGLVLDGLLKVMACEESTILTAEGGTPAICASRGPQSNELSLEGPAADNTPLAQLVLARHDPVIVNDTEDNTPQARVYRDSLGRGPTASTRPAGSWLGVPLVVESQTAGALTVSHSEPSFFTEERVSIVQAFADLAALAIGKARLTGQVAELAAIRERQRLARELHDSVSQALYGIGLGARTARTILDRVPLDDSTREKLAQPLDYTLNLSRAGLAEMRALIFELHPDALEREGLVAALEKQTAPLGAGHELEVRTTLCEEPDLPLGAKEALFRVAQEALNNVVKHANAVSADVRLDHSADGTTLEIADDGVGFDAGLTYPGHLGLESMRERIGALGGSLTIESGPELGTVVRAWLPVGWSA